MEPIKYPIYIRETKEFKPRNIFRLENWKIGFWQLLIVILIILGSLAYQNDTEQCFNVLENPCDFIDSYNCGDFPISIVKDFPGTNFDIYDAEIS